MSQAQTLNLEKIKERDENALRELFDLLLPRLRVLARNYSRGPDADDLANEALLTIYSKLDKAPLEDADRLVAWCTFVARNVVRNTLRQNLRQARREETECHRFETSPSAIPFMTDEKAQKEFLERLLETLPQPDRELVLAHASGKTLREIAKERQEAVSTVYRRYNRVLAELRRILERLWGPIEANE